MTRSKQIAKQIQGLMLTTEDPDMRDILHQAFRLGGLLMATHLEEKGLLHPDMTSNIIIEEGIYLGKLVNKSG